MYLKWKKRHSIGKSRWLRALPVSVAAKVPVPSPPGCQLVDSSTPSPTASLQQLIFCRPGRPHIAGSIAVLQLPLEHFTSACLHRFTVRRRRQVDTSSGWNTSVRPRWVHGGWARLSGVGPSGPGGLGGFSVRRWAPGACRQSRGASGLPSITCSTSLSRGWRFPVHLQSG